MNKIVNNIAQIADAAEYFDKKTGAAWKLRNFFTNALVWPAYSLKRMSNDANTPVETLHRQMVLVASMRVWAKDVNTSGLILDLTPSAIGRTLGLERNTDIHEEACRTARMKCQQLRSASRFKEFYDKARNSHEAQMQERREAIEDVADICSDSGFCIDGEFHHPNGLTQVYNRIVTDEELYDEEEVTAKVDQLAETLGNILESMYDVCDGELSAAITVNKVSRLSGYLTAIRNMMEVAGVDTKRMAQRRSTLNSQIDAEVSKALEDVKSVDAQIAEQLANMTTPPVEPVALGTGRRVIKSPERLAREQAEAEQAAKASAQQAEAEAKAAKAKAKREAKKLKSLQELGANM